MDVTGQGIPDQSRTDNVNNFIRRNPQKWAFLTEMDESKIITILLLYYKRKNKMVTDCNDINMMTLRTVIRNIIYLYLTMSNCYIFAWNEWIPLYNCNKTLQRNVQIDVVDIKRVTENNFLGVTIESLFNWEPHITHLQSNVSRTTAGLYKANRF